MAQRFGRPESAAIFEPSRQITTALVAGALVRAAMDRAKSPMTMPSAPSATLARISGRSGASNSTSGLAIKDRPVKELAIG